MKRKIIVFFILLLLIREFQINLFEVRSSDIIELSLDYKHIVEPNETVEVDLKIKNTSGTYLWKCKAFIDLELLKGDIQYFTVISEPIWNEKIGLGVSKNGKIKIKISSSANDKLIKLRIPITVSGTLGHCEEGCVPFIAGPFYVEIIIKNKAFETFNDAELLYKQEKYEEAMKKYTEALKYFAAYCDEKNVAICEKKILNSYGFWVFNLGISYYNSGDLDKAEENFEDAKSMFKTLNEQEMIGKCEDWIEKVLILKTATPPPTITPAPITSTPTTVAPTTPPPTTTPPITTQASPKQSNYLLYIGFFVVVIVILLAVYQTIRKSKPEGIEKEKDRFSSVQIEETKTQIEEKKKYIENYRKIMEQDPTKREMVERLIKQYEEEIKELKKQVRK